MLLHKNNALCEQTSIFDNKKEQTPDLIKAKIKYGHLSIILFLLYHLFQDWFMLGLYTLPGHFSRIPSESPTLKVYRNCSPAFDAIYTPTSNTHIHTHTTIPQLKKCHCCLILLSKDGWVYECVDIGGLNRHPLLEVMIHLD